MKVQEHRSVTAARARLEEAKQRLEAAEQTRDEAKARAKALQTQAIEADVAAELGEGKAGAGAKLQAASNDAQKEADHLAGDVDRKRVAVRILSERLQQAEAEATAEVQRYHDKQVRAAVKTTAKALREAERAYLDLKAQYAAAHDAGVKLPNPLDPGWEFIISASGDGNHTWDTIMGRWIRGARHLGFDA